MKLSAEARCAQGNCNEAYAFDSRTSRLTPQSRSELELQLGFALTTLTTLAGQTRDRRAEAA